MMVKMVNKYNNIKNKIEDKQIEKIKSIDELGVILDKDKDWEKLKNHYTNSNEVDILYNSYEWIIFIPLTAEVSREYGDISWCTVYESETYFVKHFGQYGSLIYCINKLDSIQNFALEQTDNNECEVWNSSDNNIFEESIPIYDVVNWLMDEGVNFELDEDSELKYMWGKISKNIILHHKPEMTSTKFIPIFTKKLKKMGIENICKEFGSYVVYNTIDISANYKKIMKGIIDKLKSNIKHDLSNIDVMLFCEILVDEFTEKVNDIINSLKSDDKTQYTISLPASKNISPVVSKLQKKNVLLNIGINKIVELMNEEINDILDIYIDHYYGGVGYLEEKMEDAYNINNNYINAESAELIEKYIDWEALSSYIIHETIHELDIDDIIENENREK